MKILYQFLKNIITIVLTILLCMTAYFLVVSYVTWEWATFPNPLQWHAELTRLGILLLIVLALMHSFDNDYHDNDNEPY